ncbi:MAG TPA: diacylglycerol kinase family protein [Pirellulales bacterium]|nr:diacylglycerol kinase family protein [Pirellulales bacterium]
MSSIGFVNSVADRVLVVANPCAGARENPQAVTDLVGALKRRALVPELVTDLNVLVELVNRYRAHGQLRAVIGAGGDGTIAEIVNRTSAEVPITVYPMGTANLLANYFDIERDPSTLAQTIVEGASLRMDAGRANGRIFLLMAGCGFDADVVERLHRKRNSQHITYWTYARPILDSIRSYRYPRLRVYCETTAGSGWTSPPRHAGWAFFVNLPCYAGGLQVAPDANGTDGLLDACTFSEGSFWHALRYLGYVALKRHRVLSDFHCSAILRARIEADEPVPYQLDGDPGGTLPLEIEVLPQRLNMIAPLARLAALGHGSFAVAGSSAARA